MIIPESKTFTLKYLSLTSDHAVAQAFWITTFAALTAVGAQLEIPHKPVPFTFQTFSVMLAGALLGKRNGFLSMILYVFLGAIGFPVFSSAGFGLARLLGPTGGYLMAFPVAAAVIGFMAGDKREYLRILGSMAAGLLIIFLLGTIRLKMVSGMNWEDAFGAGFLIFSWWDLLKLLSASAIAYELAGRIRRTS